MLSRTAWATFFDLEPSNLLSIELGLQRHLPCVGNGMCFESCSSITPQIEIAARNLVCNFSSAGNNSIEIRFLNRENTWPLRKVDPPNPRALAYYLELSGQTVELLAEVLDYKNSRTLKQLLNGTYKREVFRNKFEKLPHLLVDGEENCSEYLPRTNLNSCQPRLHS